jgi:hypothetical protein
VDWVYLAQNKDQWRSLVNMVMNRVVWETSCPDKLLLASQDGICSISFIIIIIIITTTITTIKLYLCNWLLDAMQTYWK